MQHRIKNIILRSLVILMGLFFFVMLGIEALYLRQTFNLADEQFTNTVKRSLFHTVHNIEEEETLVVVNEIADGDTPEAQRARELLSGDRELSDLLLFNNDNRAPVKEITIDRKGCGITATQSQAIERSSQNLESTRNLLLAVMARKYNSNANKFITDRINPEHLYVNIKEDLRSNNIDLGFSFALFCPKTGDIRRFDQKAFDIDGPNVYQQKLFPHEMNDRPYYLAVYFPNRTHYFMGYIKLTVAFMAAMALTMILCIITMIYLLRQQQLSAMQSEFVKNMTHELKTPVASISLAAQMLSDPSLNFPVETTRRMSSTIGSEAKRLVMMIDKVLQTSVLEKDGALPDRRPNDVNEIIEKATENFRLKVENLRNGQINTLLEATESTAMIDEVHFENIIFNLMDNAVKYSNPDKPLIINIRTYNAHNRLNIEISDNGIGIDKANLKHIFEKYYRVPTGDRHDVKGYGLGLAYVKNMVRRHNGHIKADSELGIGTTFTIDIPVLHDN